MPSTFATLVARGYRLSGTVTMRPTAFRLPRPRWRLAYLLASVAALLGILFGFEAAQRSSAAAAYQDDGAGRGVAPLAAATYVVNSTASTDDATTADGVCADSQGRCTLRAAITQANANPGADVINFNIPCLLVQGCVFPVITSSFPDVTGAVTIDGTTQRGSCDCVIVNGALRITGGNSVVRGLWLNATTPLRLSGGGFNIIKNNRISGTTSPTSEAVSIVGSSNNIIENNTIVGAAGHGVHIHVLDISAGTSGSSSLNQIRGNTIGRATSGSPASDANGVGVTTEVDPSGNGSVKDNVIESNVISGNTSHGVQISKGVNSNGEATGNFVRSNKIGVDSAGTGALGNGGYGVRIYAAPRNNIIGGGSGPNIIAANQTGGVFIHAPGGGSQQQADNNRVQGNYIGPNVSGNIPIGNTGVGIEVQGAVQNVTIEANVISWNSSYGIKIQNDTVAIPVLGNHQILYNLIGTNAEGTAAIPNGNHGIWIQGVHTDSPTIGPGNVIAATSGKSGIQVDAPGVQVIGNRIGTNAAGTADISSGGGVSSSSTQSVVIGGTIGTTPGGPCTGDCNLISGGGGIFIPRGQVVGNYIGTDVTGMVALGNPGEGILTTGATIGGTTPQARNVISGNSSYGVLLVGDGSRVQGNYIGVGSDGNQAIPNAQGIEITIGVGNPAGTNTIGGATPGAGNVISGNTGAGIVILQPGQLIQGNFIGTQANGSSPLGNGAHGVWVRNATNNAIGGANAGEGNVIAFNGMDGVFIEGDAAPATGNAILSNSIFSNAGLGIDLFPDGVTANDAGDGDPGANNLQNFPVLTVASSSSVQGTLNSAANTTFTIQLFSNAVCDLSGNGEGQTFVGSTSATTGATGNATFTATLAVPLTAGQIVTSTATDPGGNTSEFSACLTAGGAPAATVVGTATPTRTATAVIGPPTAMSTATATAAPAGIGGRGFAISSDSGGVHLSWLGGTGESGYFIQRIILADGSSSILPSATTMLPASATTFNDPPAAGQPPPPNGIDCYVLLPQNTNPPNQRSDLLCVNFGFHSASGSPQNFTMKLNQSGTSSTPGTASFTWEAPAGVAPDSYVLRNMLTNADLTPAPAGSATSATMSANGASCYALGAIRGGGLAGYTDWACGLPGFATLSP